MDTPFENLSDETRAQWLDNPTTQAFFKTLKSERGLLVTSLVNRHVSGAGANDLVASAHIGGGINAIDFTIRLANWG